MSELERNTPARSGLWRGLGLFILWLIRLAFALGLGVVIGAGIFYTAYVAIPAFYTQIYNPIQVQKVEIDLLQEDLQSTQSSLTTELRAAREEIRALQRLTSEQNAQIGVLQSALATEKSSREQAASALRSDVNRLDDLTQKQVQTLGKLETNNSRFETDLSTLQVDAFQLQRRTQANEDEAKKSADSLKALQGDALRLSADLAAIRNQVLDLNAVITMPISLSAAFERRLLLMQASEAILKARLHLLEKNAGFAAQSLEAAQLGLKRFASLSTDIKPELLAPLIKRAETASSLIESDPFTAVQELEIIWNNLEKLIAIPVSEVTPASSTPAATVAPTGSLSPTAPPTPAGSVTPAASPTQASGLATPPATVAATTPPGTPSPLPTR
jgi:hypothetical protein